MPLIALLLLFFSLTLHAASPCPFCEEKVMQVQQVYQGCHWRVLLDYRPAVRGHLLLIPIVHRLTRHELTWEEHEELFIIEDLVHEAFKRRFGPSIEDLQYEKNGPSLQSVNHFHIHVLPITQEQGTWLGRWKLGWSLFIPRNKLSEAELEAEKKIFIELFEHQQILPASENVFLHPMNSPLEKGI